MSGGARLTSGTSPNIGDYPTVQQPTAPWRPVATVYQHQPTTCSWMVQNCSSVRQLGPGAPRRFILQEHAADEQVIPQALPHASDAGPHIPDACRCHQTCRKCCSWYVRIPQMKTVLQDRLAALPTSSTNESWVATSDSKGSSMIAESLLPGWLRTVLAACWLRLRGWLRALA